MESAAPNLKTHLNGQTGKIGWSQLQYHFARGAVMRVAANLDLIDVALHLIQDDKAAVTRLMDSGQLAAASDEDARHWQRSDNGLWAVVVAPWVLVQAVKT